MVELQLALCRRIQYQCTSRHSTPDDFSHSLAKQSFVNYQHVSQKLLFILANHCYIKLLTVSAVLYVFCLLVVLVKLSLLAKLLARKTPLSSESSPLQLWTDWLVDRLS